MLNKSDIEYIKKEYKKIQNLYLAGQYKEVIQKTKVLLKKDPSQATFFNYIALSYNSLRKIDVAKEYLLKGLEYNPNNPNEIDTIFPKHIINIILGSILIVFVILTIIILIYRDNNVVKALSTLNMARDTIKR